VQPIGGVNVKVEGFFEICRSRGLTGAQGVLVPVQNVPDLMLQHDVVQAVRDGRFHIYAIHSIAQGIEILTGVAAGAPDELGVYPDGTVFGRVQRRLEQLAEASAPKKSKKP
jgi:predicted ATP-dependent protease